MCPTENKAKWTDFEDKQLIALRKKFFKWNTISEKQENLRSPFQCFQRFIFLCRNDCEPEYLCHFI